MNKIKFNYLNLKLSLKKHKAHDTLRDIIDKFGVDAFSSKQLFELMKTLNGLLLDTTRFNNIIDNYVKDVTKAEELRSGSISDLLTYMHDYAKTLDQQSPKAFDVFNAINYLREANSISPRAFKRLQELTEGGAYNYLGALDAHYMLNRLIEDGSVEAYQLIESAFKNGAVEALGDTLLTDVLIYLENPGHTPLSNSSMAEQFPVIAKTIKLGLKPNREIKDEVSRPMSDIRFRLIINRMKIQNARSYERLISVLEKEGINTFSRENLTEAMLLCAKTNWCESYGEKFIIEAINRGAIARMRPEDLSKMLDSLFDRFTKNSFTTIAFAMEHGAISKLGSKSAVRFALQFKLFVPDIKPLDLGATFSGDVNAALPLTTMMNNGLFEVLETRGSLQSFFNGVEETHNIDFIAAFDVAKSRGFVPQIFTTGIIAADPIEKFGDVMRNLSR